MKFWVLVGFFSLATAPSAFALESLVDAPPERFAFSGVSIETSAAPTADDRKQANPKPRPAAVRQDSAGGGERPRDTQQRNAQAEESDRRRQREEQRRRRSGSFETVPDAVLIGGRGAL